MISCLAKIKALVKLLIVTREESEKLKRKEIVVDAIDSQVTIPKHWAVY